jgi:predicted protein tyrosine phosphatase
LQRTRPRKTPQDQSEELHSSSLSVLYSSWSNLPIDQKSDYKVLKDQFKKNYLKIKSVIRPKKPAKLVPQACARPSPIMDLREKYKIRKQKQFIIKSDDPLEKLVNSIKKTLQDFTYKTNQPKSLTSILKNSIFDLYVTRDEPLKNIQETELSRIPFKEQLLLTHPVGEIFISGIKAAGDLSILVKKEIKSIISLGSCNQLTKFTSITGGYLELPIKETTDTLDGFRDNYLKAIRFLDRKLKEGNVLICCFYGVCRSCMVAISFIMKIYRVRYAKALSIIKLGRPCCEISPNALSLLLEFEFMMFPQPN